MEAKEVPLGGRLISISAEVGNCFWRLGSNVEVLVVGTELPLGVRFINMSAAWWISEIKRKNISIIFTVDSSTLSVERMLQASNACFYWYISVSQPFFKMGITFYDLLFASSEGELFQKGAYY